MPTHISKKKPQVRVATQLPATFYHSPSTSATPWLLDSYTISLEEDE